MQKTLVIFDVDGTLVYSNRVDSQCFAETYEQIYQKPFPTIDWTHYPHVSDTTIFKTVIQNHFQREYTASELKFFHDTFVLRIERERTNHPEKFHKVPGARQAMINLLSDDQFVVGIATGGWRRPAQIKLDHVGIPHETIHFHGADNKFTREAIVQAVLDDAHAQHQDIERVVYIGDAIWDVHTTRNMNMPLVGIRRLNDRHVLLEAGVRHVIQDYLDYEGLVEVIGVAVPPGVGS